MKTVLFILTTILFVFQANSQTKYSTQTDEFNEFHLNVSSAERMYKNDSFLQAYAKFDLAINSYKGAVNPTHYFSAAICALRIKEEFKALTFLEKAITNGYDLDSTKSAQIVFYNQNTKNEYIANLKKWEDEGKANRNVTWENALLAQQAEVQKYKKNDIYGGAIRYCAQCLKVKTCSKTDSKYKYNFNLIKEKSKADSIVATKLIDNIKQIGFPNLKVLNKKSCEIARTILLNYDSDNKNEILNDIFVKALNDGFISPEYYATVVDRRNINNNLPPDFLQPIKGYEKTPAKELNVANEKRKSIGLYTISIAKTVSKTKNSKVPQKELNTNVYDY